MHVQTFPEQDVGLGTAYERVAIYRLFDQWLDARPVKTALEGPIDGMAGIGGLHLVGRAKKGTHVRVELPDEEALKRVEGVYKHLGISDRLETRVQDPEQPGQGSFELVLTYNALALIPDWQAYLDRMARRSTRYFLCSVTSPFSYGVMIRKGLRILERGPADELFDHPSTRPEVIEPLLRNYGRIVEHQFLDCPWWPDLFVETGQSLLSGSLKRLPFADKLLGERREGPATEAGYLFGPQNFPLFTDHPNWPELAQAMKKHPVFDGKPERVARMFGHHHAYLVERASA